MSSNAARNRGSWLVYPSGRTYISLTATTAASRNTAGNAAAACLYAAPFTAVLETESVFGVQFHPEKSGAAGRKIVENFLA